MRAARDDESYIRSAPEAICPRCEGNGWLWWFEVQLTGEDDEADAEDADSFTCPRCNGTGRIF
jgi:RecJ-like exonuclease